MSKFIQCRLLASASAGAMLAIGLASGATAQSAPSNQTAGNTLETIVVTARKREENLQTTPLAITAFSANMLARQQINTTEDLQNLVPSLVIVPTAGNIGTDLVSLRGFSAANPTNLLEDAPIGTYLDGVYIGRSMGNIMALIDMERVEVEAGPQGTLFGRNVTGGAISYFTKQPAKQFGVQEKVGYGSFNDFITRTTIDSGELGDTGFYAKLAYMHHDNDGYEHNPLAKSGEDPGAIHSNSLFFALHGNLSSKITMDYKADYDVEHDQSPAEQIIGGTAAFVGLFGTESNSIPGSTPFPVLGTPGPTYTPNTPGATPQPTFFVQPKFNINQSQPASPASRLHVGGQSLTLNLEVNDDVSVKSITGYRTMDLLTYSNFGGNTGLQQGYQIIAASLNPAGPTHGFPISTFPTAVPLYILSTHNDAAHQFQWSEELQLNGKFSRGNYVVGLYYFDENVRVDSEDTPTTVALLLPALPPGTPGFPNGYSLPPFGMAGGLVVATNQKDTGETTSRAVYGDVNYTPPVLSDKLELSGGIRWTWDTKHIDESVPVPSTGTRNWYNLAGSGAVKYRWTNDVMTYLRIGSAYKAGGYNPQQGNTAFNPEGVISYEAGVKSDWLDHHVRVNADVYYTDYTNQQIDQSAFTNGSFTPSVINAGRSTYTGFEAQASILPARGWQLDGGIGLIAPKYLQFNAAAGCPVGGPVTAACPAGVYIPPQNIADVANFAYMAKLTLSGDVQYSFEPMPFGDLTIRGDWHYRSRLNFDPIPVHSIGTPGTPNYVEGHPFSSLSSAPPFNDVGMEITLANIPIKSTGMTFDAEAYAKNLLGYHPVLTATELTTGLGWTNEVWGAGRTFGIMLTGKF
jgi:iron complex outermembrane receptor protein